METTIISTDVAIIGGGLAGLSAATYLARAGMEVTLFEKSNRLGGARLPRSTRATPLIAVSTPSTLAVRAPGFFVSWA